MDGKKMVAAEEKHLIPLDKVNGYDVRPGFYGINGATALREGVNFTVCSLEATAVELLLYHRGEKEPYAILPFPKHYRIGSVYSMIVFDLDICDFEYAYRVDGPCIPEKGLIFDKTKPLLDPYARAVTGQSIWGEQPNQDHEYRARVVVNDFDWGNHVDPVRPIQDLIIYELHVRGFTKDASSGVSHPGTFAGIKEKIPYLKELGITAVELMPVFEFDETMGRREVNGRTLLDYWGYRHGRRRQPGDLSYPRRRGRGKCGKQLYVGGCGQGSKRALCPLDGSSAGQRGRSAGKGQALYQTGGYLLPPEICHRHLHQRRGV